MAKLAMAAHTILGFDAVRVPFCQTFEAHALGCMIKPGRGVGGVEGVPGIDHPPPYKLDEPSAETPCSCLSPHFFPQVP